MIRAGFLLGAAGVALAATAARAQTESRVSADVSATGGYSSNPFTVSGDDTGAAVVTIDIAPRYQLLTPRSTITVSADANIQQYISRYGNNVSYAGAVDYQGQPSERVTAHARIDLSSAVLGAFNSYLPFAGGIGGIATPGLGATTDTGTAAIGGTGIGGAGAAGAIGTGLQPIVAATPLVSYTDVGLYGLRNRRRSARASGDLGFVLSARDSLTVGAFGELTRYRGLIASDYDAYGGSLAYQRRLSNRLSVGLSGSASNYSYHSLYSDTRTYSIQATASAALNERWTANGALGVTFVDGGGDGSTRSTSLSGSLDLCRRGPHSSMCLQAVRQASPTGIAGTQYVTTAGFSWNRQLDERQNVTLNGTYSKVGGGTVRALGGLPLQSEYVQGVASYGRRLAPRLRFVASANYRELLSGNAGRSADYGGQVGLSYRFGDRR